MTQKKDEVKRAKKTGFSYPPEMEYLVKRLQKERKLSSEVTRLLATEYKINLKAA